MSAPAANQLGVASLRETLREHLPLLAERYGVASLALFGSRVRGETNAESDLDVLVRFNNTPGLISFNQLENHLSDLLGLRVDLVMADALKPAVKERVLAEMLPV